jgi:broad specificity phosphatase PhoE
LRAVDAADFTQGKCQPVLTRIGRKRLQQLAGRLDARRLGGNGA